MTDDKIEKQTSSHLQLGEIARLTQWEKSHFAGQFKQYKKKETVTLHWNINEIHPRFWHDFPPQCIHTFSSAKIQQFSHALFIIGRHIDFQRRYTVSVSNVTSSRVQWRTSQYRSILIVHRAPSPSLSRFAQGDDSDEWKRSSVRTTTLNLHGLGGYLLLNYIWRRRAPPSARRPR